MKRLIYISLLCIAHTLLSMDALWVDEENSIAISPFTNAVHQRYYFIARLEPAHTLIESLDCACVVTLQEYQALLYIQSQHPCIIDCIHQMQQDQSCKPLLELWRQICAYKYLTDDQFLKEYISVICVLSQQLIVRLHSQLTTEDQKTLSQIMSRAPTNEELIGSHSVAFRYYLIKRLNKFSALLDQCVLLRSEYAICDYLPVCSDKRIVRCAHEIENTSSLKPLRELLNEFLQFQSIESTIFIHELLQLILVIEQHALAPLYLPAQRELCAHYEHEIIGLSVEELLKSIDILTAHIEPYACAPTQNQNSIPSLSKLLSILCTIFIGWYAFHTPEGITQ